MKKTLSVLLISGLSGLVHAGPYAPAAGQPGSTALSKDDAGFIDWASGWQDYLPGAEVDAQFQTPDKATGVAVGDSFDIVTLGRGGSITLTFDNAISNGPGADFAVFENSFSDTFLELAWVEVSSDGTNFARFPGISLTPGPVNAFGSTDPTNIDGFAGKYKQGFGTPFDLDMLAVDATLDLANINYVRIVDIVGDGNTFDNATAAQGGPHPVYDPYPTIMSAGFDLDAIGVIHTATVPVPAALWLFLSGLAGFGLSARRG